MRTLNRWLLVAASCLIGCGGRNVGPYVSLVVAQPEQNNTCPSQGEGALNTLTGLARTRLTVRIRRPDNTTLQICDLLLNAGDRALPPLRFPAPPEGSRVDFFAEAFRSTGVNGYERIASGALFDQSLTPSESSSANNPRPLTLVPTESFRCLARPKLRRTRAFHSATRLTNGQILFVGGLATSPIDNAATGGDFYILGSAEVYDPTTQSFVTLTGGDTLTPRAFHQAAVLPAGSNPNQIEIVLVGGISYAAFTGRPPAAFSVNNFAPSNLRLTPDVNMLTVPPIEILIYDTAARTLTLRAADSGLNQLSRAVFQGGTALPGQRLAIAGGFTSLGGNPASSVPNNTADLITGASTATSAGPSLPGQRVAPGLLPIDGTSALLVSGNDPTDMTTGAIVEPVVRIDYAQPSYAPASVTTRSLSALWFPTVTAFSGTPATQLHALVSGGFLRDGSGAYSPPSESPMRLDYEAGTYSVTPVGVAGDLVFDFSCPPGATPDARHLRPVAWNAATQLRDPTRILLSGGTPRFGSPICSADCEESDSGVLCAVHQALLYDGGSNQLQPFPAGSAGQREGLQIARWGHTQTLLPDGTVLVAGGFTRRGQCQSGGGFCGSNADCIAPDVCSNRNTIGTVDLELFNPARRSLPTGQRVDLDDPLRADLDAESLDRAPGEQAHTLTSTAPDRACTVLRR